MRFQVKRRTDHKLYFPEDILEAGKAENPFYTSNFKDVERIGKGGQLVARTRKNRAIHFIGRMK